MSPAPSDAIAELRYALPNEEFDYPTLTSHLSRYASPRSRITEWLRQGKIVRVKKGLYVFGELYRRRPYSRELLANLIYGPSVVSLDWMLSRYGLIPERVATVTCSTPKRPREFVTPVGSFSYHQVPAACAPLGLRRIDSQTHAFLAATPERALADKVRDDEGNLLSSRADAERYLFEDLRLDEHGFRAMDASLLSACAEACRSRKLHHCAALLRSMQEAR
jgi:hypothetical protein